MAPVAIHHPHSITGWRLAQDIGNAVQCFRNVGFGGPLSKRSLGAFGLVAAQCHKNDEEIVAHAALCVCSSSI